jgi:hypothetical protein
MIALPARAPAQVTVGIRLGPEVRFSAYSAAQYGDWRTSDRQWRPVTYYAYNGRYYTRHVRGSRPVQMYRHGNQNFLPPEDQGWVGHDRRYNRRYRPNNDDYGRARGQGQGQGQSPGQR